MVCPFLAQQRMRVCAYSPSTCVFVERILSNFVVHSLSLPSSANVACRWGEAAGRRSPWRSVLNAESQGIRCESIDEVATKSFPKTNIYAKNLLAGVDDCIGNVSRRLPDTLWLRSTIASRRRKPGMLSVSAFLLEVYLPCRHRT